MRHESNERVVVIDMRWVNRVKEKVEGALKSTQLNMREPTIFKVHLSMRSGDPEAYTPKLVSIGPYHRGKPELKAMEALKWQIVHYHISKNPGSSIDEYLKMMKELEPKARSCYSEEIEFESNDFVEMMLLDSCFLVHIFPMMAGHEVIMPLKHLMKTKWLRHVLIGDLLKLENQLPFFIMGSLSKQFSVEIDLNYLSPFSDKTSVRLPTLEQIKRHDFYHLLHLFHFSYFEYPVENPLPPQNHDQTFGSCSSLDCIKIIRNWLQTLDPFQSHHDPPLSPLDHSSQNLIPQPQNHVSNFTVKYIPCATELVDTGVKFKVRSKAKSFLDVSFDKGVLAIPTVDIVDHLHIVFRNLIALEQHCSRFEGVATAYFVFINSLINSPRDVALLQQKGILVNWLGGNKEVAKLFNRMGKSIVYTPEEDYLAPVFKGLNTYCELRWHKWRVGLVRDYFSNPWTIISVGAAATLLSLTFTQTVFSILTYYQHSP